MSRFGNKPDAVEPNKEVDPATKPPLETDVEKAKIDPPPSTDSLGLNQQPNPGSVDEMLARQEGQAATQDEINQALQRQADQIRQAASAQPDRDLTKGNIVSGTMTTHSLAYDTLSQLNEPYKEGRAATKPVGYYTVHFGTIKGKKGPIKAESVGSQFYYDPERLDADAETLIKRYVKAGLASYEGSTNDDSATAE